MPTFFCRAFPVTTCVCGGDGHKKKGLPSHTASGPVILPAAEKDTDDVARQAAATPIDPTETLRQKDISLLNRSNNLTGPPPVVCQILQKARTSGRQPWPRLGPVIQARSGPGLDTPRPRY